MSGVSGFIPLPNTSTSFVRAWLNQRRGIIVIEYSAGQPRYQIDNVDAAFLEELNAPGASVGRLIRARNPHKADAEFNVLD